MFICVVCNTGRDEFIVVEMLKIAKDKLNIYVFFSDVTRKERNNTIIVCRSIPTRKLDRKKKCDLNFIYIIHTDEYFNIVYNKIAINNNVLK